MENSEKYIIENGILMRYLGDGDRLVVPEGVTSISEGYTVFKRGLSEIAISGTVEHIPVSSLRCYDSIKRVTVSENNPFYKMVDGDLYTKDGKTLVCCISGALRERFSIPDGVEIIGDWAFYYCRHIKEITIPEGVQVIGEYAFNNCSGISRIVIPQSVRRIGKEAFAGCISLAEPVLLNGTVDMGEMVFGWCHALKNISLPKGMKVLADRTFRECRHLVSVTVPEGVEVIGSEVFEGCLALETVSLPEGLIEIGHNSFGKCGALRNIRIPNSVTNIRRNAFAHCSAITEMDIPDGVSKIKTGVFFFCRSLKRVRLPEGLTHIGESAFESCGRLESINVPDSVVSIGKRAFADCESLREINIPERLFGIGEYAFLDMPMKSLPDVNLRITEALERSINTDLWIEAVRVWLDCYYSASAEERNSSENREWTVYVGKRVRELFPHFVNYPAWYVFIMENKLLSHKRIDKLLVETTNPESRAILLNYAKKDKSGDGEGVKERYKLK